MHVAMTADVVNGYVYVYNVITTVNVLTFAVKNRSYIFSINRKRTKNLMGLVVVLFGISG